LEMKTILKGRVKELEKIGEVIAKIGKNIPNIETIYVVTEKYKADVSLKQTNRGMNIHNRLAPIAYFFSVILLGIGINILTDYISVIPNTLIRSILSVFIVIIGIVFGYWNFYYLDND